MKIISLNVNGIRAGARKGVFEWLEQEQADFVCIQETKAKIHQLRALDFFPETYHCFYHDAQRPGYSGVAIYSKHQPELVQYGIGWSDFDAEGRFLQLDIGRLSIISLYLPSGSSKEERQQFKFDIMQRMSSWMKHRVHGKRQYIICGDWNIAHTNKDIKNWKNNQKNSGFLPEERAWLSYLFDEQGWVDAFRQVDVAADRYTWWSNRGRARENNVGWRIDYQIASPGMASYIQSASIFTERFFSDHAPLIMTYDWNIEPSASGCSIDSA